MDCSGFRGHTRFLAHQRALTSEPGAPDGREPTWCFTGDALITMVNGDRTAIAAIRPGDLVLGLHRPEQRVIDVQRSNLGDRGLYAFNDGPFFVTPEHPFLTEHGWKALDPERTAPADPGLQVGQLRVGDRLFTGQPAPALVIPTPVDASRSREQLALVEIHRMRVLIADPATPLYNLVLAAGNEYFVNDFLTHNKR